MVMSKRDTAPAAGPMSNIAALADRVRASGGWARRGLAIGAGAVSVLAMAPFHVWPVLLLTLPCLVWLIDGAVASPVGAPARGRVRRFFARPVGQAFSAGWLFAFGYFLAGLFWIGEAFLVEAEKFAVFIPLAITLIPAGLALFWGAASAIAAQVLWRPGWRRLVALALMLAAAEWLRGHVFTGFPWNVLGYALTYPLPLMQGASLLGIYGLTLVTVVCLGAPLLLYVGDGASGGGAPRLRELLGGCAIALGPIAALALWGAVRLAAPEPASTGQTVRVVQPSVPQREKWRPENQERIFNDHLLLSRQRPDGSIDDAAGVQLIVWPEAAMPFLPLNTPVALERIGEMLPKGVHLVSGGLRLEPMDPRVPGSRRRVFNSLIVFGEGGRPVATYDKIHLVPFGEYLPAQGTLEAIGLEQLSRLRGGFDAGPTPRPVMAIAGLPSFLPLVCYEAIFPRAVVQGDRRPAVMVNITNDGWFGNTTGPRQHLHQARVRAVEEGLPLIRAANNGISAVIDARGRVLARLDLDVRASVDAVIPGPMPPTLYGRLGDLVFAVLWVLMVGAVLLPKRT